MKKTFLAALFFILSISLWSQTKLSIQVAMGGTLGMSNLIYVGDYTPHFSKINKLFYSDDITIKYYFNPKTYIGIGLANYGRGAGVRVEDIREGGGGSGTSRIIGPVNKLYNLLGGYNLIGDETTAWSMDIVGGVQFEEEVDRIVPRTAFSGLELIDYTNELGWYPILHLGTGVAWQYKRSKVSLRLVGGLGIFYRNFYHYRGYTEGQWYEVVNRVRGDYAGWLLTYEWGWTFKKKDKKTKKKKR